MSWEDVARRRLRLWWLGLVIGLVAGFVLALVVTAPPVWINSLP